jgi:arginase
VKIESPDQGSEIESPSGKHMSHKLIIVGAPSSAGAYAPGQEKAPEALRNAGLLAMLQRNDVRAEDAGDVSSFRWRPDPMTPRAMNHEYTVKVAREVAEKTRRALSSGNKALILGGDCTIEVGTVSGALQVSSNVGLIYVDLDVDLHTPQTTTDGALDWMGVAHMLGVEGVARDLKELGPCSPLLPADGVFLFGYKNVEPAEQKLIDSLGIKGIHADAVASNPRAAGLKAALDWGQRFSHLLIHLDVDIIDFENFPIAENTRRKIGLTFEQVMTAVEALLQAPNWGALTITEVNPDHGLADGSTIRDFASAVATALGRAPSLVETIS